MNCLMTWEDTRRIQSSDSVFAETSGSAVCQDGNGSGGSLLQQTGLRHAETEADPKGAVLGSYLYAGGHAGEQFQIDRRLAWREISMPAATRHIASDEEANQLCSISGASNRSASFRNGGTSPNATPTGKRSTGTMNEFDRSIHFVPGLSTRGGG